MVESCVGCFSVLVVLRNVDDGVLWGFSGVYGHNDASRRRLLWEELAGVVAW